MCWAFELRYDGGEFFAGASFWCEYESVHIQYEKLIDSNEYDCILTLLYTRK